MDSHLQTLPLSPSLRGPPPLITSFPYSQESQTAFLWPGFRVPTHIWPRQQAAFPSPILPGVLTCRPSSRAMPSRVVSGGALAGVAVLQASCASLKSRAGEWIFCWMEPNTMCSHLGSPGVGGGRGTWLELGISHRLPPHRHEHGGSRTWQ